MAAGEDPRGGGGQPGQGPDPPPPRLSALGPAGEARHDGGQLGGIHPPHVYRLTWRRMVPQSAIGSRGFSTSSTNPAASSSSRRPRSAVIAMAGMRSPFVAATV